MRQRRRLGRLEASGQEAKQDLPGKKGAWGESGVVRMFLDKKSGPERWRNKNRTKINKTGNSCKASEASTESDNLLLCSLDSLSEILANAEERFLLKNETLFLFVF